MYAPLIGVSQKRPFHLWRKTNSDSGARLPRASMMSCSVASSGCSSRLMRSSFVYSSAGDAAGAAKGAVAMSAKVTPRARTPGEETFEVALLLPVKPRSAGMDESEDCCEVCAIALLGPEGASGDSPGRRPGV